MIITVFGYNEVSLDIYHGIHEGAAWFYTFLNDVIELFRCVLFLFFGLC